MEVKLSIAGVLNLLGIKPEVTVKKQHEDLTTPGWYYAIRIGTKNRTKLVKADNGAACTIEQLNYRAHHPLKPLVGMRRPERRRGRRALFKEG